MNVTESGFKNRQLHIEDYLQRVSAEQKEYAEVFDYSKITEKSGVITDYWTNNLLELILRKDNLNNAYKQVKKNKGKGGIDGMQVDELLPFLKENQESLIQEIREGRYKPNPVRMVEIPKETMDLEKFVPLSTTDEYFQVPDYGETYLFSAQGQTILLDSRSLAAALARLPEQTQEEIFLYYFQHLTQKEIGEQSGWTRSTIGRHIQIALKQLKEEMEVLSHE